MELELVGVSKAFPGGMFALEAVNLKVASGERIVVVGPSGCGKTTLLRLIAGLERADSGSLRMGNQTVEGTPPWQRPVGMVFQKPALIAGRTTKKSISTVTPLLATENAEEAAEHWIRKLDLERVSQQRVEKLSGGQVQRVALARALVRGAPILLLDEPLGALDAILRAELRQTLREEFRQRGTTVLWVSHDPEDAWALADRIVVMANGRFSQIGFPENIRAAPASRAVLELFQDHWGGVNFVEARMEGTGLRTPFGLWPLPCRRPQFLENAGISLAFPVSTLTLPYNGANRNAVPLRMVVERRGFMQSGIRVLCRNDQGQLWATGSTENQPGEMVTLMMDLERALWFDARDGKALVA